MSTEATEKAAVNKSWECSGCPSNFENWLSLSQHIFERGHVDLQLLFGSGPKPICVSCGKLQNVNFNHHRALLSHSQQCCSNLVKCLYVSSPNQFKCPKCVRRMFPSARTCIAHLNSMHRDHPYKSTDFVDWLAKPIPETAEAIEEERKRKEQEEIERKEREERDRSITEERERYYQESIKKDKEEEEARAKEIAKQEELEKQRRLESINKKPSGLTGVQPSATSGGSGRGRGRGNKEMDINYILSQPQLTYEYLRNQIKEIRPMDGDEVADIIFSQKDINDIVLMVQSKPKLTSTVNEVIQIKERGRGRGRGSIETSTPATASVVTSDQSVSVGRGRGRGNISAPFVEEPNQLLGVQTTTPTDTAGRGRGRGRGTDPVPPNQIPTPLDQTPQKPVPTNPPTSTPKPSSQISPTIQPSPKPISVTNEAKPSNKPSTPTPKQTPVRSIAQETTPTITQNLINLPKTTMTTVADTKLKQPMIEVVTSHVDIYKVPVWDIEPEKRRVVPKVKQIIADASCPTQIADKVLSMLLELSYETLLTITKETALIAINMIQRKSIPICPAPTGNICTRSV
eukprot:NODE_1647_length_1863_cov_25.807471_g1395_i0.p1 GENE.NODE_1647_length_1863_cov_25.807471_g1395_i0~~NODE_1647_length_1863_cov_25.807471_g1395_i0.p1  ORF type:complete len:572 (-),score=154.76 NODE_1647_length_1863_cov_25.807471_g1395_i0:84-1799(-)